MQYALVFDVADRVPEIALGTAALVAFVLVVAAGLWAFDDLIRAWPFTAAAAITIGVLQALNAHALASSVMFLAVPSVAAIAEVVRSRVRSLDPSLVPRGGVATMFATFLLMFDAFSGLGKLGAVGLSNQLRAGDADQIEGTVSAFFEVYGGKNECFSIGERRFCYSDYVVTPGFNRTRALGGPISPGLQVRLSAIGDTIVRLEVAGSH